MKVNKDQLLELSKIFRYFLYIYIYILKLFSNLHEIDEHVFPNYNYKYFC